MYVSKNSSEFGTSSGAADKGLSRSSTLPGETSNSDKIDLTLDKLKLERSKSEKRRLSNKFGEQAAQIFDAKISPRKKTLQLKMLNRIATVKDDGTIEFEVPVDVKPGGFDFGTDDVYSEVVEEEPVDSDLQYIPPLQIVMLIVGTRGDVQPFIAIGKRLQDYGHRVRLATHANFKEFVLTAGLEFFPLGGDPKVLAEWHTHVAEALNVPVHIFFTMPWTLGT
ncbi:hypothetical protein C5167_030598 [Papaver somniferum]|nr:hypothetical protein C5167_030598 [Papaver somniferum]